MSDTLAGFPYQEIEFTRDGDAHPADRPAAIVATLTEAPLATDLLVLSHGWNNDLADARSLYERLATSLQAIAGGPVKGERHLAILGLFWPSKKFTDEDLIPGGGVASGGDVEAERIEVQLDRLKDDGNGAQAQALDAAKAEIADLETEPEARRRFVEQLRLALGQEGEPDQDAADRFFTLDPEDLFRQLEAPLMDMDAGDETGGVAGGMTMGNGMDDQTGGAAGLGDFFGGIKNAASQLLNLATYYQMKTRAGTVGSKGVAQLLRQIRTARPHLRIHLVGHSFGARLVTAAALATGAEVRPASLTLLQGAFSHNGFSGSFEHEGKQLQGHFRRVISEGRISGPIVITHTRNDKAVGLAYALASRISGDVTAGVGDADDVFGGMGRNGARHTSEGVFDHLLGPEAQYSFEAGRIHNLQSDEFISGHSDITGPAVGNALLSAIGWPR